MELLARFQAPPPSGWVTVVEKDCQFFAQEVPPEDTATLNLSKRYQVPVTVSQLTAAVNKISVWAESSKISVRAEPSQLVCAQHG